MCPAYFRMLTYIICQTFPPSAGHAQLEFQWIPDELANIWAVCGAVGASRPNKFGLKKIEGVG